MDAELLEYGDRVELRNGDTCVYVRREINSSAGIIFQELLFINVFTGEEHILINYKRDLTNCTDSQLDIVRFVN